MATVWRRQRHDLPPSRTFCLLTFALNANSPASCSRLDNGLVAAVSAAPTRWSLSTIPGAAAGAMAPAAPQSRALTPLVTGPAPPHVRCVCGVAAIVRREVRILVCERAFFKAPLLVVQGAKGW